MEQENKAKRLGFVLEKRRKRFGSENEFPLLFCHGNVQDR
jgi:hypothetical protein